MKTLIITIPGWNRFRGWLHNVMSSLRATVCAWWGHSHMATQFFGEQYCARCGQQIGDSLAGMGRTDILFVGDSAHDCPECRERATKMTWRDTFLTPHKIPDFDSELTIPQQKEKSREMMEDLKRSIDERMMADAAEER